MTDVVRQEQRQKEELASALVAAEQANAAKSDFLSRMSHEIRTPMNAIIGMSAIAARSIGDDEQVADCISKIGISSRFLLSLINDILDMSRIESGKMLLKKEKIPSISSVSYTHLSEPFDLQISAVHQQKLAADASSIDMELSLRNSSYAWQLRFFFILTVRDGRWMIRSFHAAEPGCSQRGEEHYPKTLVMENVQKQRQQLLNDSIAGGMMGGYIEPGFPFYYINRWMLDYLGYESEEEFVQDIGGLISNCMHPDDLDEVEESVNRQLEQKGEYTVEYLSLIHILGDIMRLSQILTNLLSNAYKFTDPGGRITLTIREEERNDGEAMLFFSVKDTGIGIRPEDQERIFLSFEQAAGKKSDAPGTGLGLSLIHI